MTREATPDTRTGGSAGPLALVADLSSLQGVAAAWRECNCYRHCVGERAADPAVPAAGGTGSMDPSPRQPVDAPAPLPSLLAGLEEAEGPQRMAALLALDDIFRGAGQRGDAAPATPCMAAVLLEVVEAVFKCLKSVSLLLEARDIPAGEGMAETRALLSLLLRILLLQSMEGEGGTSPGSPGRHPACHPLTMATHVTPLVFYLLNLLTQHVDTPGYPVLELMLLLQGLLVSCYANAHVLGDICAMYEGMLGHEAVTPTPGQVDASLPPDTPLDNIPPWAEVIPFTPLDQEREALVRKHYRPTLRQRQREWDARLGAIAISRAPATLGISQLYAQLLPHLPAYAGSFVRLLYHCGSLTSPNAAPAVEGTGVEAHPPPQLRQSCAVVLSAQERSLLAFLTITTLRTLLRALQHLHHHAAHYLDECLVRHSLLILLLKITSSHFPPAPAPPAGPTAASATGAGSPGKGGAPAPPPPPSPLALDAGRVRTSKVLLHLLCDLIHDQPHRLQQLVGWKVTGLLKRCLRHPALECVGHALFRLLLPHIPSARKYVAANMPLVFGVWREGMRSRALGTGELHAPGLVETWLIGEPPSAEVARQLAEAELQGVLIWHAQVHGVELAGLLPPEAGEQPEPMRVLPAASGVSHATHPVPPPPLSAHFQVAWEDWVEELEAAWAVASEREGEDGEYDDVPASRMPLVPVVDAS